MKEERKNKGVAAIKEHATLTKKKVVWWKVNELDAMRGPSKEEVENFFGGGSLKGK